MGSDSARSTLLKLNKNIYKYMRPTLDKYSDL